MKITNLLLLIVAFSVNAALLSAPERVCKTKDHCKYDSSCQCYCSVKCGYRDKNETDNPVYVEKGVDGIHCFCKQTDLDEYTSGVCKNGKVSPRRWREREQ